METIKELKDKIEILEQDKTKDHTEEITQLENRIFKIREYFRNYRSKIKAKKEKNKKVCPICHKEFISKGGNTKYCEDCREIALQERIKKYRNSERYKEIKAKYQQSERGKATVKKYHKTEKYKEMVKRYNQSEKAKEKRKRYNSSIKGLQTRLRYLQRVIENGGQPLGTRVQQED